MSNFVTVRLGATWIDNSVISSGELREIDSRWPKLINAEDGSTHSPTGVITIGGAGMTITGPSILNDIQQGVVSTGAFLTIGNGAVLEAELTSQILIHGAVEVTTNGTIAHRAGVLLTQELGVTWNLAGQVTMGSTSNFTFDTGATVLWAAGTTNDVLSGSTWRIYNDVIWQAGKWPEFTTRTFERHSLTIAGTRGGLSPKAWKDIGGNTDKMVTASATSAGDFTLIEFTDLPEGATITGASITSRGLTGTDPTLPRYEICKWDGTGTFTAESSVVVDANDATWLTDKVTTSWSAFGSVVVDHASRWGIKVLHPWQTSTGASVEIFDAKLALSATQMKL